jgi:hypothetical protein
LAATVKPEVLSSDAGGSWLEWASPELITLFCPLFGRLRGCAIQH